MKIATYKTPKGFIRVLHVVAARDGWEAVVTDSKGQDLTGIVAETLGVCDGSRDTCAMLGLDALTTFEVEHGWVRLS
jgi:hypothetical protein